MKRTLFFLMLLFTSGFTFAQVSPDDELLPDDLGSNELEESPFEFGNGSKSVTLQSVSLRLFCPPPRSQAGLPAGIRLGLVFGYGAMTVLKAKQQKWGGAQVQRDAFSAYFPFELLPKEVSTCNLKKTYMQALGDVLTQTGNLKAAVYDKTPTDCRRQPNSKQKEQARQYRIDRLQRVFGITDADAQKVFKTQQSLRAGRPVVVMLQVDAGFNSLRADTWIPDNQQISNRPLWQPVLVIGYDNTRRAFDVFNSMGSRWGKNGFARIRYDDYTRRSHSGVCLIDHPDVPLHPSPKPQEPVIVRQKPAVLLRGGGSMQQIRAINAEHYETLPIAITRRGNYYETNAAFAINEQMRFVSSQLPHYGYVYIFSIDPNRKAELHFPRPGESAYVADDESRLVFPRPRPDYDTNGNLVLHEQGFSKEVSGTDWLVILYSKKQLDQPQLAQWMSQLSVPTESVMPTLEQVLGNQLVPWRLVRFEAQAMRFTVEEGPGTIVPVALKINGR